MRNIKNMHRCNTNYQTNNSITDSHFCFLMTREPTTAILKGVHNNNITLYHQMDRNTKDEDLHYRASSSHDQLE